MEALDSSVLDGPARPNVQQLDAALDRPGQKAPPGQFRPVIAADCPGQAALTGDRLEHPRHPLAGKAGVHLQRQALPRIGIHHAKHADRAAALDRIVNEVERPLLVGRRARRERPATRAQCLRFRRRIANPASQ